LTCLINSSCKTCFYLPTRCTISLFCNKCITLNTSTRFEQYYAHLLEVKIVFLQHLVSSLSVSGRTVHRLRVECCPLSTGARSEKRQSSCYFDLGALRTRAYTSYSACRKCCTCSIDSSSALLSKSRSLHTEYQLGENLGLWQCEGNVIPVQAQGGSRRLSLPNFETVGTWR
jgi:hypothetical protein